MPTVAAGGRTAIQVRGAKELAAGLRKAGIDLKDLREQNKQAAQVVVGEGRRQVPVRSGSLQRSIRAGATQKAGVVRAGNNGSVPYANPIHWGWPGHHIEPHPFLTQAAKDTEPEWVAIYQAGVEKIISRISGATS